MEAGDMKRQAVARHLSLHDGRDALQVKLSWSQCFSTLQWCGEASTNHMFLFHPVSFCLRVLGAFFERVCVFGICVSVVLFTAVCDTRPLTCLRPALFVVHKPTSQQFAEMHAQKKSPYFWSEERNIPTFKHNERLECQQVFGYVQISQRRPEYFVHVNVNVVTVSSKAYHLHKGSS